jgi:hypothetical protein
MLTHDRTHISCNDHKGTRCGNASPDKYSFLDIQKYEDLFIRATKIGRKRLDNRHNAQLASRITAHAGCVVGGASRPDSRSRHGSLS